MQLIPMRKKYKRPSNSWRRRTTEDLGGGMEGVTFPRVYFLWQISYSLLLRTSLNHLFHQLDARYAQWPRVHPTPQCAITLLVAAERLTRLQCAQVHVQERQDDCGQITTLVRLHSEKLGTWLWLASMVAHTWDELHWFLASGPERTRLSGYRRSFVIMVVTWPADAAQFQS